MPASAQDAQTDLLGRINGLRSSLGLEPYRISGALNAAAGNHASWMSTTGEVSHVQYDGSRPRDRASAAGYASTWVSENIYMGSDGSPSSAWTFWLNSPVHYAGLTNTNYQEVGIGAASGSGGTAFVLVFGNPGGASAAPRVNVPGSDGEQAASGPPPWVVGVDPQGNIMHEVREADTWGDILLDYGYDWDDLERVLALNGMHMIPEDIRSIKPGDLVLVPPYQGTYTPTAPAPNDSPGPTSTPEAAESAEDSTQIGTQVGDTSNPSTDDASTEEDGMGIIGTQSSETTDGIPTESPLSDDVAPSLSAMPTETATLSTEVTVSVENDTTEANTAPGLTPTPTMTTTPVEVVSVGTQAINNLPALMVRTLPARTLEPTQGAIIEDVEVSTATPNSDSDTPPIWLLLVLSLQVVILGVAGFQMMRQRRK